MRKLSKLIATAVSLIAVSFTGCSNLVDDATIDSEAVTTGARSVTLTATSENDIVKFSNGSARMIMPDQIDATTGYDFWLFGENETTGTTIDLSDVTKYPNGHVVSFLPTGTSTTKGTVTLTLDIARYKMNLYVCKTTDKATIAAGADADAKEVQAKKAAWLWAQARADFTYGDTVNFHLTPYGLEEGGTYGLAVYLDGWTMGDGWHSTVSIKNLKDGTAVANAPDYTTDLTPAVLDLTTTQNVKNETGKTIKPGTYNFVVDFYNAGLDVHYYYSDRIVIFSNQTTKKEIKIPNVIGVKPAAPEALGISYVDPVTATQDYYELAFEWTDKSYNEAYFQLELVDITDVVADIASGLGTLKSANGGTGAAAVTSTWEALTAKDATYGQKEILYKFGKQVIKNVYNPNSTATPEDKKYEDTVLGDFDGNTSEARYVDGSFRMNNTAAVIRVDLGRRYIARLAAVNAAGPSDYIYPDLEGATVAASAGFTRASTGEAIAASALKKFGADAALINRYRITYNLDGGSFYEADTLANGQLPTRKDSTKVTAVDGLLSNGDTVIRYGTQAATAADQMGIMNALYTKSSDSTPKKIVLYDTTSRRWSDWLYMSTSGDVYETGYNTTPANDAEYAITEVPYMQWDETNHKKAAADGVVGFSNITLYATYKSAGWEIDHSTDFNIQDSWILMYYDVDPTGANMAVTPDTSKVNGTWTYVYGTDEPTTPVTGQTTAAHIYALLLNDATNTVNGVGVTYTSVVADIIRANGGISKSTVVANTTKKQVASKDYTVVDIDISKLAADTYTVVLHAYADTTQKEYTYTIAINVGQ